MNLRTSFGRFALLAGLAAVLCGCSTLEHRSATAPIEVIESNYIESTNDAEIVHVETPSEKVATLKSPKTS